MTKPPSIETPPVSHAAKRAAELERKRHALEHYLGQLRELLAEARHG